MRKQGKSRRGLVVLALGLAPAAWADDWSTAIGATVGLSALHAQQQGNAVALEAGVQYLVFNAAVESRKWADAEDRLQHRLYLGLGLPELQLQSRLGEPGWALRLRSNISLGSLLEGNYSFGQGYPSASHNSRYRHYPVLSAFVERDFEQHRSMAGVAIGVLF